jgi:hypothetical protein
MLSFGLLWDAILLVLGCIWCGTMLGRWREDLARLRESEDRDEKMVIVGMWVATAVILVLVVNFLLGVLGLV